MIWFLPGPGLKVEGDFRAIIRLLVDSKESSHKAIKSRRSQDAVLLLWFFYIGYSGFLCLGG